MSRNLAPKSESTLVSGYLSLLRLRAALASNWRVVAGGALAGWALAVLGGAFLLAGAERYLQLSPALSDLFAIALPLAGLGLGGLEAHRRWGR